MGFIFLINYPISNFGSFNMEKVFTKYITKQYPKS